MNNLPDKNIISIIITTVVIVFFFIFSVKSPERKVIESPIMWKDQTSSISFYQKDKMELKNYILV